MERAPPHSVIIEPTNACNYRCFYCPTGQGYTKHVGFMDWELFERVADQVGEWMPRVHLFRRGESLLHPRFLDMAEYLQGKAGELFLTTNGSLLTHEKADRLKNLLDFMHFSIHPQTDGPTLQNIQYFLDVNERVRTQVSLVRTVKVTDFQVVKFKMKWMNKVDRVRIFEQHSADGEWGSLSRVRTPRLPCAKPFSEMLVYWDGVIGRCNHDWSHDGLLGDVNERRLRDIWNEKPYERLREEHTNRTFQDPVCHGCDSWYPNTKEQGTGEVWE